MDDYHVFTFKYSENALIKESAHIEIRQKNSSMDVWISQVLKRYWASVNVVSRGQLYDASKLPAIIAYQDDNPIGLLTYHISGKEYEIVTLNSLIENMGVGSKLIQSAKNIASTQHCERIWLITTNDNLHALYFYQKRGFTISTIYCNAIEKSRQLKPNIPLIGSNGIPIRDEIELEMRL